MYTPGDSTPQGVPTKGYCSACGSTWRAATEADAHCPHCWLLAGIVAQAAARHLTYSDLAEASARLATITALPTSRVTPDHVDRWWRELARICRWRGDTLRADQIEAVRRGSL